MESASYYRARIAVIQKLMEKLPISRDDKNPERTLVRNGYIPESLKAEYDRLLKNEYLLTFMLNQPLSFTDITSFNTWFEIYPEKVSGREYVTSSREFPITVEGSKETIVNTIRGQERHNILELEALSIEVELQLLKI